MVMISPRYVFVLTVFATLATLAPPALCASDHAAMPCCKRSTRCDFAMGTNSCCSVERVPAEPRSPSPAARMEASAVSRPQTLAAGPAMDHDPAGALIVRADRLWYPPTHDRSTPLFLRNASILR